MASDNRVNVRRAAAEDYEFFTTVWPELGIDDPIASPERFADRIAPTALISELDDEPAGYIHGRELDDTGHVVHLMVSPAHRRRGIARALMLALADLFRDRGLSSWCLNVKPDNVAATTLYRSLGFRDAYESHVLRFGWKNFDGWEQPSTSLEAKVPSPTDDNDIEKALGITAGMLASRRQSGDYELVALRQGDEWMACAAFSPSHPGAFPFRVRRPDLALPLLAALRTKATKANMQVVAEDDPELARYLMDRGASEYLHILHMVGELPQPSQLG